MKKSYALAGIMILAAVLLVLPVGAKAEMYVEAYLGGTFAGDLSDTTTINSVSINEAYHGTLPGVAQPAVIGGLKVGTWFVKEGFLGMNYPDWMKYFGFCIDFSFHRLDNKNQNFNTNQFVTVGAAAPRVTSVQSNNDFRSEGTVATLAFMFAARYGFLPDSEVPFGRLQPYVAVGPAIMFSSQRPTLRFITTGQSLDPGSQDSTDICLAVDAGIRYMALKNVSIDASFKYRWANPSYEYSAPISGTWAPTTFKYEPTYNLFSFQLGAAYHF
jgi:opacity protein-like surface antigen